MAPRALLTVATLGAALGLILAGTGCERGTDGLGIAPVDTNPDVFLDGFADGVDFQAFLDTKLDAVDPDARQRYRGRASLRVTVPGPWDDTGLFAGGAFTAGEARDLSGYNALTFWAKATKTAALNTAGLGNDNTGTSLYQASRSDLPLTFAWTKYVIPIPLPAKLGAERGLFFFAEGHENNETYDFWFDEVRFEYDPTITNPRPTLVPSTEAAFVGQTLLLTNTRTTFSVGGVDRLVEHSPGYFTFISSDTAVAQVVDGEIELVGPGTARITAKLGDIVAGGAVTLNSSPPPLERAPTPALPAGDVISLFSNAYENRVVDTWSTPWDNAGQFDFEVGGDDIKAYTNLVFAAIEFATETVDASEMTHFHVDVWGAEGFFIKVKLVDFGANGVFGGGDDSPSQFDLPVGELITAGEWTSLDIPMTKFRDKGLAAQAHLAQLIFEGGTGAPVILYVDNIYFHK